jgi:dipeptidyl aminopeptidase/acylaminoacyl peptidase
MGWSSTQKSSNFRVLRALQPEIQMQRISKLVASLMLGILLSSCGSDTDSARNAAEEPPVAEPVPSGDSMDSHPMLDQELLSQPESYTAPQVSPDGRLLSWIAPFEGTPNLFVAPIESIESARPLTKFTDSGVRATDVSGAVLYRWHYDSAHIIFPKDYEGDENWDIHIVDVNTAEVRNLTPLPDKEVRVLAYGRADPGQMLISIETFGQSNPDVFRLDLVSGERELVQANDGALGYVADNALNIRVRIDFNAEGGLDFFKFSEGSKGDLIYQVQASDLPALTTSVYQKIIRFDQANEKLYLYDAQGRDTAALIALNVEDGTTEVIAEDGRVDIAGVLYRPVDNSVQAYATNWTRTTWSVVDPELDSDFEALSKIEEGDWTVVSQSDDNNTWIVRYMASHKPIVFHAYSRDGQESRRLFTATPQLEGLDLSPMHAYELTTDDGFPLVGYVSLPPWTDPDRDGRPDQPVPMVVYIHGGPSDERAQYYFAPMVHSMNNRGLGFLFVNFRGSAGFGKAYMNAQKMEWGGKMHQDVLDQVEWAIAEGIADPQKIGVLGGSYGGYAVLVGMTMTPDVFACGVDVVGPSNLEIFMPHWDEDRMGDTIGDPRTEEGRAFLRSRSPINFAHQTKNPVLIAQGTNDSRVPQEQSDIVVEKMQEAGAEVTYLIYPDEGHGFIRPANSRSFSAITEVFLGECLGGRYEPLAGQLEGSSVQVPVGVGHIPGLAEALAARTDTGMPDTNAIQIDPPPNRVN